jgi:hypothetical protein
MAVDDKVSNRRMLLRIDSNTTPSCSACHTNSQRSASRRHTPEQHSGRVSDEGEQHPRVWAQQPLPLSAPNAEAALMRGLSCQPALSELSFYRVIVASAQRRPAARSNSSAIGTAALIDTLVGFAGDVR